MNYIKKMGASLSWRIGIGPVIRIVREPALLILAYHSIYASQSQSENAHISVSKTSFEAQINYLESRGYRFVYFRDLLKYPAQKVVAVYFDDGFKDVLDNVYPMFKNRQIPATLFLTTDYADQKKVAERYLTWEQARAVADVFEFGSHSVSHRKLNKISLEDAREELIKSKKIIEERLGISVVSFSYPYGRSNGELENIAEEVGYKLTTADSRFHKVRPDPDDNAAVFKWKALRAWS